MILEIVTKNNKSYRLSNQIKSIRWSDKYGCYLVNDAIHINTDNVKRLTYGDKL